MFGTLYLSNPPRIVKGDLESGGQGQTRACGSTGASSPARKNAPLPAGQLTGRATFQTAEAVQQETLFRYLQVIQTAFQEVNDSLVDQQRTREQLASLRQQVESLREYAALAWLRFEEGYSTYLEVTYAQNRLFAAELTQTGVQGSLLQAFANLYKAMGVGG